MRFRAGFDIDCSRPRVGDSTIISMLIGVSDLWRKVSQIRWASQ